jgi:hypothetical protein
MPTRPGRQQSPDAPLGGVSGLTVEEEFCGRDGSVPWDVDLMATTWAAHLENGIVRESF